jgi:hypothetical protein
MNARSTAPTARTWLVAAVSGAAATVGTFVVVGNLAYGRVILGEGLVGWGLVLARPIVGTIVAGALVRARTPAMWAAAALVVFGGSVLLVVLIGAVFAMVLG